MPIHQNCNASRASSQGKVSPDLHSDGQCPQLAHWLIGSALAGQNFATAIATGRARMYCRPIERKMIAATAIYALARQLVLAGGAVRGPRQKEPLRSSLVEGRHRGLPGPLHVIGKRVSHCRSTALDGWRGLPMLNSPTRKGRVSAPVLANHALAGYRDRRSREYSRRAVLGMGLPSHGCFTVSA